MEAWAFLACMAGTAVALLVPALLASSAIAFFLPARAAKVSRVLVEWATALSGAGYLAVALNWTAATYAEQPGGIAPGLLGSAIAIAYLPLWIVLLLRALEPRWPALLAGRALGLRARHIAATLIRSAATELQDASGLYMSRLLSDAATLMCILWMNGSVLLLAPSMLVCAVMLAIHGLLELARSTGAPAYPPLYGPLPELPPRLQVNPKVSPAGKVALQLSFAALLVVIALEISGLEIFGAWVATAAAQHAQRYGSAFSAIGAALQGAIPGLALTALLVWWRTKRAQSPGRYTSAVALATISPIAWAYPAALFLQSHWLLWLALAAGGLTIYVVLQTGVVHALYALTAKHTLAPGENTPAAAVRSLGLSISTHAFQSIAGGQALSAAAAWFGAAALLVAVLGIQSSIQAACALVWALLAGAAQAGALWQRRSQPNCVICNSPVSATMEALSHDAA